MRDSFARHPHTRWSALVLGAALAAPLLSLSGCGASEATLMSSAQDYLRQGDRKAAVIQLKTVLQKNPQLGQARLLMGQALLESGDAVGAEVELGKAQDLGVAADQVVPLMARALLALGQPAKVIERWGSTPLGQASASADLGTSLASAHLALGRTEEGRAALTQALQSDAQHGPALLLKARLAAADGQLQEALSQADALVASGQEKAAALVLKGGLILRMQGMPKGQAQAQEAFEAALKAQSDHIPAHLALVSLAQAKGDEALLRQRAEAFSQAAPRHPMALLMEGQFALQDGKLERALKNKDLLLKGAPGDPRVQMLAARVAEQNGAWLQAENHTTRALQLAPQWPAARMNLARLQLRSGQVGKTLETLQPLIDSSSPQPEALAMAGQALLQDGQIGKAEPLLRRAMQLKPEDPNLRTLNALTQLGKGQDGAVLLELESIAADDRGVTADLAIISTRLKSRDTDGALKAVASLQAKRPTDAMPHQLAGQVHLSRNDTAAARKSFEKALSAEPNHLQAAAALARLDWAEQQPDRARSYFERMVERDAKNAPARLAIIEMKARQGASAQDLRTELEAAVKAAPEAAALRLALINHLLGGVKDKRAALAAAQDASAAYPEDAELLDALGRTQLANDAREQASATFARLAQLQPQNVALQLRQAQAQVHMGEHEQAVRTLRRALEIKADNPAAQRELVASLLHLDRRKEADDVIRQMQRQQPQSPLPWLLEGDLAMQSSRPAAAVAAYRQAMGKQRNSLAAMKLHNALLASQQEGAARELADSWEKSTPADAAFQSYLADVAIQRARWQEAETRLKTLLKQNEDNVVALNNLAYSLAMQRKPGGVELAEKANRLSPNVPTLMDTLAAALAVERQFTKAIEWQKKAVAKADGDPQLKFNLARIYIEAGEKAAARKELEQLATLGSKFSQQAQVDSLLKSL